MSYDHRMNGPARPATTFLVKAECGKIVIKYTATFGGEVTKTVASAKDLHQFLVSKANEAGVGMGKLTLNAEPKWLGPLVNQALKHLTGM